MKAVPKLLMMKMAHKFVRDVKFPMLLGMGPVRLLFPSSLHPIHKRGLCRCEILCSPRQVYIAFYIWILSQTPFHLIGSRFTQWFHCDKDTHLDEGWEWRISPCSRKWKWKRNNACSCNFSAYRTNQDIKKHKTYTHVNVNDCIWTCMIGDIHTLYSHIGILKCKLTFLWQSGQCRKSTLSSLHSYCLGSTRSVGRFG